MHAITVHVLVLSTLRFLSMDTFQQELANLHLTALDKTIFWMQSSAKWTVTQFPYTITQQVELEGFFLCHDAINWFPNTNRAIDGTHIAMKSPSQNNFNYVKRKGFHSLCAGDRKIWCGKAAAECGGQVERTTRSFCRTAMLAYTPTAATWS